MTPGELLVVLDHALAPGHKTKWRLQVNAPVVTVVPRVERGTYLGDEPDGSMGPYGYTKRQCKRLRKALRDAAREDAVAASDDEFDGFPDAPSMRE